jgi:hypothetical protein
MLSFVGQPPFVIWFQFCLFDSSKQLFFLSSFTFWICIQCQRMTYPLLTFTKRAYSITTIRFFSTANVFTAKFLHILPPRTMATRSDDAAASQRSTPARNKSSKSGRTDNTDTPPQTPGVSIPASTAAIASSSSSSSSMPTPPSSGRSTAHANRHHRHPSAALRAARVFLSSPPSPLSPPAAPSPPTSPSTTQRQIVWPSASAASGASAATAETSATSAATMPSTPRIPREETPEVSQIPADQAFCACCDNGDPYAKDEDSGKGKQRATTSGQGQPAVYCAVHGDGQAGQTVQTTSLRPRGREPGSLTKMEAQREFLSLQAYKHRSSFKLCARQR